MTSHRFCMTLSSIHNFSKNLEEIMKQKFLAFAAIIVLKLVILIGCSPDDDAAGGSPLVTGRLADLQGTWTRNCYSAKSVLINNDQYHVIETYRISGSNISTSKTYYATNDINCNCLLYTSPSPRDRTRSRMPSSA